MTWLDWDVCLPNVFLKEHPLLDGGDLLMQLEKDFLKTQSHDIDDNEDNFDKTFF